jgi:hypothetical protein
VYGVSVRGGGTTGVKKGGFVVMLVGWCKKIANCSRTDPRFDFCKVVSDDSGLFENRSTM